MNYMDIYFKELAAAVELATENQYSGLVDE